MCRSASSGGRGRRRGGKNPAAALRGWNILHNGRKALVLATQQLQIGNGDGAFAVAAAGVDSPKACGRIGLQIAASQCRPGGDVGAREVK